MTETIETSILEEGNVKITNLRAIIGTKTYAMSNVTSVSLGKKKESNTPLGLIILGAAMGISGLFTLPDTLVCVGIGGVLAVMGVFGALNSKPTYMVRIGSASGESNILESTDLEQISRIVAAMNDAIVRRG